MRSTAPVQGATQPDKLEVEIFANNTRALKTLFLVAQEVVRPEVPMSPAFRRQTYTLAETLDAAHSALHEKTEGKTLTLEVLAAINPELMPASITQAAATGDLTRQEALEWITAFMEKMEVSQILSTALPQKREAVSA